MDVTILIAGGGIGGLSAALCLAKFGFAVRVFEQASVLGEIGAGIQLSPNCTRVLFDLGLEESLQQCSFTPEGGEMRAWDSGEVLNATPLGAVALKEYGFPYLHIHRADLINVLAQAVVAHPLIHLQTDATVVGFDQASSDQNSQGAVLTLDIAGRKESVSGDVIVGADGIRSVVRENLFGPQDPTFTGNVAWRALVPVERLPKELVRPMATAWWGPGKHFVHYYVRGGELVNCVCVVEKEGWEIESWSQSGEHAELKSDFAGWHADIQMLIDHADRDSMFKWALFDRRPMHSWGEGRVTLLGDACHPTLPFMAQGAAMAIEDGAVLARCLARSNNVTDIAIELQNYASCRKDRTARIRNGSRRNAKIFHLRGAKAWARNQTLKTVRVNPQEWIFRYDALTAHNGG